MRIYYIVPQSGMEILGLLWMPDFLVWIFLVLAAIYIYGTWNFGYLAAFGYSGPKPKPVIGNLDLIMGGKYLAEYDLIGKKLYGKVYSMYEGSRPSLVVFDTDVLKQVLVKDFPVFEDRRDLFLRGPILGSSLFDLRKDNGWKRVRTLTTPFFTTNKLKNHIPLLDFCVNNLKQRCDEFAERDEQFDMKDVSGAFTLEAICLTAFGIEVDSQNNPDHKLLTTIKTIFEAFDTHPWQLWAGFLLPALWPVFDKLGMDMWPAGSMDMLAHIIYEAISDRQNSQEDRPDFIHTLIKAHDAAVEVESSEGAAREAKKLRALTDLEIAGQGAIFILAGFDTTSIAISFLLFNIANNPQCQSRLKTEIDEVFDDEEITYEKLKKMTYLDMCLEETLRMFPPLQRNDRKCLQDITINGYFIPKDTVVIIPIYGLQHDPELWDDPDKFDPERFSPENRSKINMYAYQPFGTGPRNCVGMRLAQLEIKMAVIKVLQNFRVKVGEKTKLPMKINGIITRAEGGVWLRVEKY